MWLGLALGLGLTGGPAVVFIHGTEFPAFLHLAFPAGLLFGWLLLPRRPGGATAYAYGWACAYLLGVCLVEFMSFGIGDGSLFLLFAFVPLFLFALLFAWAGLALGRRMPRPTRPRRFGP